jgi:hypothetical protein
MLTPTQDSRALRGMLPFDLLYYDELANQQEIVRLTVSARASYTSLRSCSSC